MGCFMGGEGSVKIDWSRYNSILCKLGFDGSFRELICSHGFEPTFECESLVGLYLPYEKHPYRDRRKASGFIYGDIRR